VVAVETEADAVADAENAVETLDIHRRG